MDAVSGLNMPMPQRGAAETLNRETSLYLDAWRLLAALIVFIGHVSGQRFTGGFLWQFGACMNEAVALFFVLSGFVIGYATARREGTAQTYAVSRLARIYSVALPALVVTFVVDTVGRSYRRNCSTPPSIFGATGEFVHGNVG